MRISILALFILASAGCSSHATMGGGSGGNGSGGNGGNGSGGNGGNGSGGGGGGGGGVAERLPDRARRRRS